jgi:integrase/recombinase XerD
MPPPHQQQQLRATAPTAAPSTTAATAADPAVAEQPADLAVITEFVLGHRSANTRDAYSNDLREFAGWCRSAGLGLVDVRRVHIEAYARSLEQAKRASATLARKLATLSAFYHYLEAEHDLPRSPVRHVKRPTAGGSTPPLGLDRAEAARLLGAAADAGPRDHALICLLLLNGLRVSEACTADVVDLGRQRGHRTLTVTRKRERQDLLALAPRTYAAIDAHLAGRVRGPLLLAGEAPWPMDAELLAARRLDRHDAARILRRLARAAGITRPVNPHLLRHTMVTLSLDAGVPLRDVQDAAGHADPRTTRYYDRARNALGRHATYQLETFLAATPNSPTEQ